MARFVDLQTNFSTGELDPLLRARVDLEQYNNALAKATNVVIQPQGGMKRRPGTRHRYELPSATANGVRMVPFEFSVTDSYMLIFTDSRMYVFKNGVVVTISTQLATRIWRLLLLLHSWLGLVGRNRLTR